MRGEPETGGNDAMWLLKFYDTFKVPAPGPECANAFSQFPPCRMLRDNGRVVTVGKCSPAACRRSSCLPVQNLTDDKTMPAALNALAYMRGRFCWVIYDAGGKKHPPGCLFIDLLAFPLLHHNVLAVPLFCHSLASFSLSSQGSGGCWRPATATPSSPCSGALLAL